MALDPVVMFFIAGYTIIEAKGKGGSGIKSGAWMNDTNSLSNKVKNYASFG